MWLAVWYFKLWCVDHMRYSPTPSTMVYFICHVLSSSSSSSYKLNALKSLHSSHSQLQSLCIAAEAAVNLIILLLLLLLHYYELLCLNPLQPFTAIVNASI